VASFTTPNIPVGSNSVTATHRGDSAFAGSLSNTIAQAINPASNSFGFWFEPLYTGEMTYFSCLPVWLQ
jgi:hypothetical protein